jgi:transposase
MGYRVIAMYQYRQIIHQIRQGLSDREIAKNKLVARTKCAAIRAIAKAQGWLNPQQPLPTDEEFSQMFMTTNRTHQTSSTVEPYRDFVLQCLQQNLSGTVIHQALINRFYYTGSYDAIRRFLKRHRPNVIKPTVPLHFEPGEAAQIDFGKGPLITDRNTGEIIDSWFFIMTLCFSRHMYVEFVRDQRVATWLGCHRRAFEFFGGVPAKLIIDNAKCAITKACFYDPAVQRAYGDYAQSYSFIISACPPREPQLKGRVESNVKYVKNNFLPLRVFHSLADANAQAKQWVLSQAGNRNHGSTHQKPLTSFAEFEKHLLKQLPAVAPEIATWNKVKVHGDCHVQHLK